ncbi:hypothetical protein [Diplocloster hominis]|uniref:hypothetical protein n=1 Tax=Diplocloster hominis TaxID=3079010 RepID=UPI0031BBAB4C
MVKGRSGQVQGVPARSCSELQTNLKVIVVFLVFIENLDCYDGMAGNNHKNLDISKKIIKEFPVLNQ